jgi:signal transduction histidine kinase
MLQETYKAILNYFLPSYKKAALIDELHLIIEFLIITFLFVFTFIAVSYSVSSKEAIGIFLTTEILFLITLFAAKNGVKALYIKHIYLFITCFITILGITFITGGLFSTVLYWFAIVPILATLLIGNLKTAMIWIVTPIIIVFAYYICDISGKKFHNYYNVELNSFLFWVSCTSLILIIFFFSFIFLKFINAHVAQLQKAQDQLILAEKLASLGELTAGISHEIQNPLNFVNNFSEISIELIDEMNEELKNGNTEDANAIAQDLKQNLEKINYHGKRAGNIVKSMLLHSRVAGQREPTDINAIADEYLRLAYHGLRAKDKSFNAKLNTDFDPNIGKINVISQEIGRVILNLISNAFYVINEKKKTAIASYEPTLWLSTSRTSNEVIISVRDNGNGIPAAVLDKIFQPFFTTKPTGQGTGLGLSLSYEIIKSHGGQLKVDTKEGEGTTFIIQIPTA